MEPKTETIRLVRIPDIAPDTFRTFRELVTRLDADDSNELYTTHIDFPARNAETDLISIYESDDPLNVWADFTTYTTDHFATILRIDHTIYTEYLPELLADPVDLTPAEIAALRTILDADESDE